MAKSDQGRAAFPYNPLIFSTSLTPAGADLPGAAILSELPAEHALLIWDVLRAVLLFAAGAGERAWWSAEQMRSWEEAILADAALAEAARAPLSAIIGELADPRECDVARLSWACLCLCDWAVERGATETALAWAEAAALAWPANARLAWIAGKMFRTHSRFTEAKQWLRRAARLAVWSKDWEVQARALIALGNLTVQRGSYPRARRLYSRALRIASRHHLREQRAMALHDLFVIAYETGRHDEAEEFCRRAFQAYGPEHPLLQRLAHDVAFYWAERGDFSRAATLTRHLLPGFDVPSVYLRVLATYLRSAGGSGQRAEFEAFWPKLEQILTRLESEVTLASSLLDIGYGASSLEENALAEDLFRRAFEVAERRGEADVLIRAESALQRLRSGGLAEPMTPRPVAAGSTRDAFIAELASSLAVVTRHRRGKKPNGASS